MVTFHITFGNLGSFGVTSRVISSWVHFGGISDACSVVDNSLLAATVPQDASNGRAYSETLQETFVAHVLLSAGQRLFRFAILGRLWRSMVWTHRQSVHASTVYTPTAHPTILSPFLKNTRPKEATSGPLRLPFSVKSLIHNLIGTMLGIGLAR